MIKGDNLGVVVVHVRGVVIGSQVRSPKFCSLMFNAKSQYVSPALENNLSIPAVVASMAKNWRAMVASLGNWWRLTRHQAITSVSIANDGCAR